MSKRGSLTTMEWYPVALSAGVLPIAAAGLFGNSLSIWVFKGFAIKSPVNFLFQYLAVWDNIHLTVFIVYTAQVISGTWDYLVLTQNSAIFFSQTVLVYTTLTVAVCRWLAVWRPQGWNRLIIQRRIITAGVLTLVWSALVTGLEVYRYLSKSAESNLAIFVSVRVVSTILPLVALLCLSICLLRKTWQQKRLQQRLQRPSSTQQHRRLTMVVLAIAACSFISYPLSVSAFLLTSTSTPDACGLTCYFVVMTTGHVMQVINSAINFLFYFLFASRFRSVLKQRLRQLGACLCRHRQGRSADPGANGDPRQQGNHNASSSSGVDDTPV